MSVNSVLLKYFIELDYRDKEQKSYKKFTGIIISYIIASAGLSVNYYFHFDSLSYAVLCFTVNSFMLAFIGMSEYPQLFFTKDQFELINTLPVTKNIFINSKFLSAFFYLLSLAFVLSISQAVFFYFYDRDIFAVFKYLLMNLSFMAFFTSLLLIIYSVALKIFSEKGTYILFIIQFLFFGLIMYSTSLGSKAAEIHSGSIMNFEFIKYIPQKFFAEGIYNHFYIVSGLVVAFFSLFVLLKIISGSFYDIYNTLYVIKPKKNKTGKIKLFDTYSDFVSKLFIKDNVEKSGFELAKNIITGSKSMLLRYLPLAVAPLIIALLGLVTGNESLTFIENNTERLVIPVLSPSITMIIIIMSRMFLKNLQIADENSNDAKWIYESLPLDSPARIFKGSFKFVYITFIILPVILITALLSLNYPVEYVVINIFFILSFSAAVMTVSFLFVKNYPFSLESNKLNSSSRLMDVFISVIYAIIIFVIQFIVFQNYTYIFISIITILIVNFLITKKIRNYGTGKKYSSNGSKAA